MIKLILRTATLAALLTPSLFAQSFCWSESTDNVTVLPGSGVACTYGAPTNYTADNKYYRRYNPLARGQTANFDVTSVTFGVEVSLAGLAAASQPATIEIYRDNTPGSPDLSMILLGSQAIQIPNLTAALNSVTFTTPIAVNGIGASDLVIALSIPDGFTNQHQFFFGGNAIGQASPTYLSSVACGLPNPTDTAAIGFPNSQMIFDVCGTTTGVSVITYCTAKTTSNSCTPAIGYVLGDTPSATNTGPFRVNGTQMINNKSCLLFYGVTGQAATAFQGGVLCVKTPIKRTPGTTTGGNPPPNDCSGAPVIDMNAFAAGLGGGSPLPALAVAGTVVDCQWWGRDPGFPAPNNTQLSNGLEYVVGP